MLKASRFAEDDVASRSDEGLYIFHSSPPKYRAILMLREFILLVLSKLIMKNTDFARR